MTFISEDIDHRKHWYFITQEECPVCGCGREYRERRYDPRPKEYEKRHDYNPMAYDSCIDL